jgi:hypothetical protein
MDFEGVAYERGELNYDKERVGDSLDFERRYVICYE